ncbi:MAG: cytochrome P450 [bacterium]|nr:cytochrome P450 [bacterium]
MQHDAAATFSKTPPHAKGLPLLGNSLNMRVDPLHYFVKLYHQHGTVFRVTILGRPYWVMAGIEANRFLAREGEAHFGSESLFGGLARELGSDALLTALDGAPHRHQRKVQRRGFSKEIMLSQLNTIQAVSKDHIDQWQPGAVLPLFRTVQKLVTDQLGMVLGGRTCGPYFDDLWYFLNTNMKAHVMKTTPMFILKSPKYLRAKARTQLFAREVLDWHRANPPISREPDLFDDLLAAVDENGKPYSEKMLNASVIGSYFAGMDTISSTISFLLASLLMRPQLLERVLVEVDTAFENGGITPEALRKMDTLHHAAMETLRLYPAAPFTPRTVTESFEFNGYVFPKDTEVYIANCVTHYLPEFYPNPHEFDPDRYDRPDHPKTAQAFAPYTLGAHTCLGAGMAEVQMMAVVASLLRSLDLAIDPPNTPLVVYAAPIPNPGPKYAIKVIGKRKPLV